MVDSDKFYCIYFDLFYLEIVLTWESGIATWNSECTPWVCIAARVLVRIISNEEIVISSESWAVTASTVDTAPWIFIWILFIVFNWEKESLIIIFPASILSPRNLCESSEIPIDGVWNDCDCWSLIVTTLVESSNLETMLRSSVKKLAFLVLTSILLEKSSYFALLLLVKLFGVPKHFIETKFFFFLFPLLFFFLPHPLSCGKHSIQSFYLLILEHEIVAQRFCLFPKFTNFLSKRSDQTLQRWYLVVIDFLPQPFYSCEVFHSLASTCCGVNLSFQFGLSLTRVVAHQGWRRASSGGEGESGLDLVVL